MSNDTPRKPVDLNTIEELNYISTLEEDAVINAFIDQLRSWGYGSINQMADLQALLWTLAQRGIPLTKLNRVAVVECIEREPLYLPFLAMARHYNNWLQGHHQRLQSEADALRQQLSQTQQQLDQAKKETEQGQQQLMDARLEMVKLKHEMTELKLKAKPQRESAQVHQLRYELKREYNLQLTEWHNKHRPAKRVYQQMMHELVNPCSPICCAYDLTQEEDAKAYIEWFRIAQRKINNPTMKVLRSRYEGQDISAFEQLVELYNQEWNGKEEDDEFTI
ncbi:MAG: hypothetical protein K6E86_07085 [Bacteroidales bacterium]|nr:hypothetical protein [Bacteroidales bacterium]